MHRRESEKPNSEIRVPNGTESPTAHSLELPRLSPSLTDHHRSALMEGVENNLQQSFNEFGRPESRARSIAGPSAAPYQEKEQRIAKQAVDLTHWEPEIIEDDGLTESLAFPPPATITPSRLKQHMRENVMFLFYTPAGKVSRCRPFAECDTVGKLFGQANAAKVYGPTDERLKPDGNVLSICFGAGQSDVGEDMRVVEGSRGDFNIVLDAIERRDWWREKDGVLMGSGILEVRSSSK